MNDGYIRRSDLMAARVPDALRPAVEELIGVYEAQQARIAALQNRREEPVPFLGQF